MRTRLHDVCIVGGGLAGLTLARQLASRLPTLDIAVVEHHRFPVSEGTHKVGESTVEIAARYLTHDLGLREHLQQAQLRKFGLRLFCRGERPVVRDLAEYDEIGASTALPIATYQLDRGRLENHLAASWQGRGELRDGTTVRSIELGRDCHRIVVRDAEAGTEAAIRCRFLVDASGRRAWLRRQLGLARPARHDHHAVWFRVAGELDIDALSANASWLGRCGGVSRRLSTNHFTGPGYWLWLIPLASGITSLGLVFDPQRVPTNEVRRYASLLRWLESEHPLLAARLAESEPLDHHLLENYAVGSAQVFSDAGWMATGDAGMFTDPFYSPGGDFIALANGYIVELIAAQAADSDQVQAYQSYYQTFFRNTLSLYRGQYAGFGSRDLLVAKTLWDYAYYWSVPAKLFFAGKFADRAFLRAHETPLRRAAGLHLGMQNLFRKEAKSAARVGGGGRLYDIHAVPLFHQLQQDLLYGDPDAAGRRLIRNVSRLESVAASVRRLLAAAAGNLLPPLDQVQGFE